ncbi:MAG: radical SAM protein [Deltaproteobacteria bacterium]|nr:radical SAM protein [Deltaproteobacteria bacterium]
MSFSIPIEGKLINVTNKCNLRCSFCTIKSKEEPKLDQILHTIEGIKPNSNIILGGGEALIRKDIFTILNILYQKNVHIAIITNGRIFVYDELVKKVIRYSDTFIYSPFLTNKGLYSRFTGVKEAFAQSLNGLKNLLRIKNSNVELRFPLNQLTITHLSRLENTLKTLTNNQIYIVFTLSGFLSNENHRIFSKILISPKLFDKVKIYSKIFFEDIPYCIHEKETHIHSHRFQYLDKVDTTCPLIIKNTKYKKLLICTECIHDNLCKGLVCTLDSQQVTHYIKPIKGVKSNSFDYIRLDKEIDINKPTKNCEIYLRYPFDNPNRYLFLNTKGRTYLYYTDTNSFSDDDIKRTKIERQQLYIDISKKTALDDFRRDIKQLKLDTFCETCSNIDRCAAFFSVSNDLPFAREERWLKEEIKRLKGKVLDVGCGDMRFYKDLINKLLSEKKIEYFGIDIEQNSLNELKKEIPYAITIKSAIEEFSFEDEYFDYIFLLRSLNHFYDVHKAFNNISRLVRNYGMIIIAECVPFALLRDPKKIELVRDSSRPLFEHYRNWSSEEFIQFIRQNKYPFKLDTHKPVQKGTSNQWIIKLMKIK